MKRLKTPALIFIVGLLTTLYGCYATPGMSGYTKETVSKVDNTRHLKMKPLPIDNSQIKVGLYKNSVMPEDLVIMIVELKGAHDFQRGSSLVFNLDGERFRFTPYDPFSGDRASPTRITIFDATRYWSSEKYEITKEFLKRLFTAKKVSFKVDLGTDFYEAAYENAYLVSVGSAFKEFYEKLMAW